MPAMGTSGPNALYSRVWRPEPIWRLGLVLDDARQVAPHLSVVSIVDAVGTQRYIALTCGSWVCG